jgi:hypothetical protein
MAAILFVACCAAFADGATIRMDARAAPTEEEYPRLQPPPPVWLSTLPVAQTIQLSAPSVSEVANRAAAITGRNPSVAFGRGTNITTAKVASSPGQSAIKVLVTSGGAIHLRVAVTFDDVAQYRVTAYAPGDETRAVSLYRITASDSEPLQTVWTPITDGEAQVVVVERLGELADTWSIGVPLVSHFDRPLYRTMSAGPENFRDSAPCQVDLACVYQVAPTVMQSGIVQANFAVALMSFTKSDGLSYYCTGTLLNTASFPSPIFMTAFHCLSDAQSLASLTTIWFFNRVACRSGLPSPGTQVAGGAISIFGSATLDAALVLLNQVPPPPATYTGWDASTMQPGTAILAIHHPMGDVKKASFGTELGIYDAPLQFDVGMFPAGTFYVVSWQLGIVEPGSSGSGLLSFDSNTGLFSLRGTLTGGDATCSAVGATTYYSRFDRLYPYISNTLGTGSTATAFVNLNQHGLTGSWFKQASSGQGVEVEVFPNPSSGTGSAFVSWFTYDTVIGGAERQRWYTAQGQVVTGQPSASLTIYQNTGGNFNAPPATNAQPVGTATLSFDTCSSGQLSYTFTDGTGRTGSIPLTRLTQNVTCSTTTPYPTNADFALSGNWFGGAATSGQGFTAEVNPNSGAFFAAWYTYMPNGAAAGAAGQRWYTTEGTFTPGMRSIPVTIYETTGGMFDKPTPPGQNTVSVGTGTMAFQSCSAATFSYNFTGGTSIGLSGTINLIRVGPVPPGCTS